MKPKSALQTNRLSSAYESLKKLNFPRTLEDINHQNHQLQQTIDNPKELVNYLQIINNANQLNKSHKARNAPKSSYTRKYYCLNYVPKRKVKRENTDLNFNLNNYINNDNLISTGVGSTFNDLLYRKNDNNWKKLVDSNVKIETENKTNRDIFNKYRPFEESEFLEFRNNSILKYAKFDDILNKYFKYTEYLSEENKSNGIELYNQLIKLYKNNNSILFSNTDLKHLLTYSNWKSSVSLYLEFIDLALKLMIIYFTEVKKLKETNLSLKNKNTEQKNKLENKASEIEEINNYIEKYKLTNVLTGKNRKLEYSEMDKKKIFQQKENAYILTIYKLEEELKALTQLLKENQVKSEAIEEIDNKYNNMVYEKSEHEKLFIREKEDLFIQLSIANEKVDYLTTKNQELEKKIKELETDNQQKTFEIIDLKAQNQNIKQINSELDSNIEKLNDKFNQIEQNKIEEEENQKRVLRMFNSYNN